MKNLLVSLALIVGILTNGCAVVTSPHTFAACKAADVATTAYALHHGAAEANPLVAGILHATGYGGLIVVSGLMVWGVYKLSKRAEMKPAVGAANVITCGAAVNNLMVIHGL